jgi:hypothetical protein
MTILTTVAAKHKGFDLPAAIAPWAVSTFAVKFQIFI